MIEKRENVTPWTFDSFKLNVSKFYDGWVVTMISTLPVINQVWGENMSLAVKNWFSFQHGPIQA